MCKRAVIFFGSFVKTRWSRMCWIRNSFDGYCIVPASMESTHNCARSTQPIRHPSTGNHNGRAVRAQQQQLILPSDHQRILGEL